MSQTVTPEMCGWRELVDIKELNNSEFFPFVAYKEKQCDFWKVVLKMGPKVYDKDKKEFVYFKDFKTNWVKTFYHYPEEPIFWLDACTESEVALACQVYSEIFNTLVKEN